MSRKLFAWIMALALCIGASSTAFAYGETAAAGTGCVVSASRHTALIDQNGVLWTWGDNTKGQLGNGTTENSTVPVRIFDSAYSVSCSDTHTAAIKTDGSLWIWGRNWYLELGVGSGNAPTSVSTLDSLQTVPKKVMDNVAAVSCGSGFTAAVKTDGTLWLWGCNDSGAIGNGGKADKVVDALGVHVQTSPVKVMDGVKLVSCGSNHFLVIMADGSVRVWGDNSVGELGNGGAGNATSVWGSIQTVPVALGGLSASAVSAPVFFDVAEGAYYAQPVAWAVGKGITNGTGRNVFSPDQTCTKAQIITFLWRAAGSPAPNERMKNDPDASLACSPPARSCTLYK